MALRTPYRDLRRALDDLFLDFTVDTPQWEMTESSIPMPVALPTEGEKPLKMTLDVSETEAEYRVAVDLPGVGKDNVNLSLENGILTISAERNETREENGENFHLKERKFGKMSRSIRVPEDVSIEEIKANYDHGVLLVKLPKRPVLEKLPAKTIPIH